MTAADEHLAEALALESAFRNFAEKYRRFHGFLPIVLHFEGYRHMGNTVEIVSANVFDPPGGAELVISNRCGDHAATELTELSL